MGHGAHKWAVLALMTAAQPVLALEAFCTHVDFCALVPQNGGVPAYNHPGLPGFNPALPWVIGGTSVVSLTAGTYAAGPSAFGPSVFVVENGTLAIENQMADVAMPVNLFLCDSATFRVRNATYRTNGDGPFAHWIWADENSQVIYQNASLASLTAELEALSLPGALLQVMQGQSTLTVSPQVPGGAGVQMTRFGDAWELAVTEQATATVDDFRGFAETYIAGTANLSINNSFFFDVFFEMCPGATQTLPALPDLCSLDGTNGPQCITAAHVPITFSVGPPATTFTLSLTNDHVFSWALSTYPGSTGTLSNVGQNANLAVGLGSLTGVLNVRAVPGNPSILTGVTDRTLNLTNAYVGFWHMWPTGTVDLSIVDSSVGDFSLTTDGQGHATASYFAGGSLSIPPGGRMWLVDAAVDETTDMQGTLWARNSVMAGVFTVGGTAWLADTLLLDANGLDLRAGGELHTLSLLEPVDNTVVAAPINVVGSVEAVDVNGAITPIPGAVLELRNANGVIPLTTVTTAVTNGVLTQLNPAAYPEGSYTLRLTFLGQGVDAYAQRQVTLVHPVVDGGVPDAGGGTVSSSSGPPSGSSTGAVDAGMGSSSSSAMGASSLVASSSTNGVSSSVGGASSLASSSSAAQSSSLAVSGSSSTASTTGSSSRAGSSVMAQSSSAAAGSSSTAASASSSSSSGGGGGEDDTNCACATPGSSGAPHLALALLGLLLRLRRRG
jgi:hypothetical protein